MSSVEYTMEHPEKNEALTGHVKLDGGETHEHIISKIIKDDENTKNYSLEHYIGGDVNISYK